MEDDLSSFKSESKRGFKYFNNFSGFVKLILMFDRKKKKNIEGYLGKIYLMIE